MSAGLIESELVEHTDRTHWLDGRACSIGSSDAAVILGYGYAGSSRYALWAEKCHGLKHDIDDATLKMFAKGHAAEPYIAKLCEIDHGWNIEFDPKYSYRRNRSKPFLTCSLDAWMLQGGEHVALEFKNISTWVAAKDFSVKDGKVPLKYTIQIQHQLLVTGWSHGYLVALSGFDIQAHRVERHPDLIELMHEEYDEFWKHVVDKSEPEIDESEPTYAALSRVHVPRHMNPKFLDDAQSRRVVLLAECEQVIADREKLRDRTRNELVSIAGDADCLVTTDGRWFSFKAVRGGKRKLKPTTGKMRV